MGMHRKNFLEMLEHLKEALLKPGDNSGVPGVSVLTDMSAIQENHYYYHLMHVGCLKPSQWMPLQSVHLDSRWIHRTTLMNPLSAMPGK